MMRTSYFAKYRGEHGVSIARYPFKGYSGRQYPPLFPSNEILMQYKRDADRIMYTDRYYDEILVRLDPQKVYDDLGDEAVLLCFEKPGDFCHRRLVASWIEDKLGLEVPEIRY
jgi:hypothetical protein